MHEGCMKQDSEPIPGADEIRPENLESLTDSDEESDAMQRQTDIPPLAQAHCCALLLRFPNNKAPKFGPKRTSDRL